MRSFDNGTWTSEEAARQAEPFKGKVMKKILIFLRDLKEHGATDQEIQYALQIEGNSERPARGDLTKLGLVMDSGQWRYTRSRRKAIVWVAT